MRKILIVGATSAIAQATARRFAAGGDTLFLVARHRDKLQAVADDLRVHGAAQVVTAVLDATEHESHKALIDEVYRRLGGLDIVLIAHGALPDQQACEGSFAMTRQAFETNALSVMSLLTHLAQRFAQQGYGTRKAARLRGLPPSTSRSRTGGTTPDPRRFRCTQPHGEASPRITR